MGTIKLLAQQWASSDKELFKTFSSVRAKRESLFIEHQNLMAQIHRRPISNKRADGCSRLLDQVIESLVSGSVVVPANRVLMAGRDGKIVAGSSKSRRTKFSDGSKSKRLIQAALTWSAERHLPRSTNSENRFCRLMNLG